MSRVDLLRFITCGSVDDGKSTLVGRLLHHAGVVPDDQLEAVRADSRRPGDDGGLDGSGLDGSGLDVSLLLDGLSAEREQGITIDVAHRYFSTAVRSFIVADTPGHEQYTRNMVTGASNADVAVVLVDARKGVVTQTRRHAFLVGLMGIRQVALAVNKMDLVGHDEDTFEQIRRDIAVIAGKVGIDEVTAIPVSALHGDNVVRPSTTMAWYIGPTLLQYLESVVPDEQAAAGPLRFPVQSVTRDGAGFRGYAGRLAGGSIRAGDTVTVLPTGTVTTVARIVTMTADLDQAVNGESVTVTLSDDVDVSRGDLICAADQPAQVTDEFEADIVWMSPEPMLPGRPYLLKSGSRTVGVTLAAPSHIVDVDTLERRAPAATGRATLGLNEIGACHLALDRPLAFDPYTENRHTGGFVIIDRFTQDTVGAGMLRVAVRRSIPWQDVRVDVAARTHLKRHRPAVIWFTGLSGSGKSTIADHLEVVLHQRGVHTYLLDGDNVRHGLNRDLGFSDADRVENIRRVAEVAALMADAGLVVLVAFISPFRAERTLARERVAPHDFIEVFVDTPLEVAEARDPKGLYARARAGELPDFTGIGSPYEPPEHPDLRIDTTATPAARAADEVIAELDARGVLDPTW